MAAPYNPPARTAFATSETFTIVSDSPLLQTAPPAALPPSAKFQSTSESRSSRRDCLPA